MSLLLAHSGQFSLIELKFRCLVKFADFKIGKSPDFCCHSYSEIVANLYKMKYQILLAEGLAEKKYK